MDTKTALGAAAGLTLTVAGGVSALFLTLGGQIPTEPTSVGAETTVVETVEFVDQYGNPVADPSSSASTATPEVIVLHADGSPVTTVSETITEQAVATEADAGTMPAAYADDNEEYETEEYETEEYEEYEAEYEEDQGYEEDEHEEEHEEEDDHEGEYDGD